MTFVSTQTVPLESGRVVAEIRLTHAERSNSLAPELLKELAAALSDPVAAEAPFVLLTAEGRNFSTGGNVARFLDAVRGGFASAYAEDVVGMLHDVILQMLRARSIIVTAAQGAVTGGSFGLIAASDAVILSGDAFLQPYYREVGFAPDGGWTAILPDLIGAKPALGAQLFNTRIKAESALAYGLADRVCATNDLRGQALAAVEEMDAAAGCDALIHAKALVWDDARLAQIETRLAAEKAAFCERIVLPKTLAGMETFLGQREKPNV
ncbi:MAG: enoyl-CoA hydratase/isomerase family protein [Rhodobacteraceae bacterium]|nr:enoyl-CoA hydratase/isomerase family protein [Paracoccaceae bacterium]